MWCDQSILMGKKIENMHCLRMFYLHEKLTVHTQTKYWSIEKRQTYYFCANSRIASRMVDICNTLGWIHVVHEFNKNACFLAARFWNEEMTWLDSPRMSFTDVRSNAFVLRIIALVLANKMASVLNACRLTQSFYVTFDLCEWHTWKIQSLHLPISWTRNYMQIW